jgi:hypothetical protein
MNLELDLLELNALYVAVSNHVKKTQKDAENYPSDFFQTQATLTEMLAEKIQLALYEKCDELDINFEADDEGETLCVCDEDELKSLRLHLAILKDEMAHYVDKRDWRMCNELSDHIEQLEERIEELENK